MAKTLIYQLYPRSWGSLVEMEDFLYEIAELGVDYVWLSPIFRSPGFDGGYDVSDYKSIAKRFGHMSDFDDFVETAHDLGIGVLMDLVLNHTATSHKWFDRHPEYYCWSKQDHSGWRNLFDQGSAWRHQEGFQDRYLHLFCDQQADLNWFPDGELNPDLVQEFREIVDFWVNGHNVDGFRLDALQCINKDVTSDYFSPWETATKYIDRAAEVVNAIFDGDREDLYLLMECLDMNGRMVKYYYDHTPINAIMDNAPINTSVITQSLSIAKIGADNFVSKVAKSASRCPDGFAQVTESHDGPRIPSVLDITNREAIDLLFGFYRGQKFCNPRTIVIYQGQELGLFNPTKEELPDDLMMDLDIQVGLRYIRGEGLDDLRLLSRANARVPIPLGEYARQEQDPNSCLNRIRYRINCWRNQ